MALATLVLPGPFAACGGDADADRVAAREEIERRFGRRDTAGEIPAAETVAPDTAVPTDTGARGAAVGSPAGPPPAPTAGRDPGAPGSGAGSAEAGEDTAAEGGRVVRPAAPPATSGAPDRDPDRWLALADSAYRRLPSLRARFEQRVEVPLLDRANTGVGVWYQRGRDRFRMDFTDPPDDLFVADGTYLWLYQPSQQPDQVIKAELAEGAAEAGTADLLGRILAEARTAYDAVDEGAETVSGVETRAIALTPTGPSEYRRVRVWIATSDLLVRRFRIEQENELVRTVTLADLEPGIALADSLFRFVVPEGVDVYEP